jgi:hypothetical protein
MPKGYTTKQEIENYLLTNIDSSFDTQLNLWIDAIERIIENYTGRTFSAVDAVASARTFDGQGGREILLDTFTEITSIEVLNSDGTVNYTLSEGQANDFVTYPYNETEKWRIMLSPNSSIGVFPKGNSLIRVTAKWGYATAVPADVRLAATQLVGEVIRGSLASQQSMNHQGGVVQSETLGDYSITFAQFENYQLNNQQMSVLQILEPYVIYEL